MAQIQNRYTLPPVDFRSFVIGLIVVVFIYAVLFLYALLFGSSYVQMLENDLASNTSSLSLQTQTSAQENIAQKKAPHDDHTKEHSSSPVPPSNPSLLEDTQDGALPVIDTKTGLTSFRAYQNRMEVSTIEKPVISLIVTDYGLSEKNSEAMLALLPPEVSLLLSPFSAMPAEWGARAREKKHEIWAHVPIENATFSQTDTGPYTLLSSYPLSQNTQNYHRTIAQTGNIVGIASYSDDITSDPHNNFDDIIRENFRRGLGYLELNPEAPTTIRTIAMNENSPYIKTHTYLSGAALPDDFFEQLIKKSYTEGHAIAVIPGYYANIKKLAAWITKTHNTDYMLAPVSFIYDMSMILEKNNVREDDDMLLPDEQSIPQNAQHH